MSTQVLALDKLKELKAIEERRWTERDVAQTALRVADDLWSEASVAALNEWNRLMKAHDLTFSQLYDAMEEQ